VFENLAAKQDVFRRLDSICRESAILATTTSTLDVDAIAGVTQRRSNVIGIHFFSPAHVMKLVEVVRGSETSKQAIATSLAVTKKLGKTGVVVGLRTVCELGSKYWTPAPLLVRLAQEGRTFGEWQASKET
jgi:3-hydroxyacyl-CoA dehydrogenase